MTFKRSGGGKGRPSRQERAEWEAEEAKRAAEPILGPLTPKGLGWGGARKGSGRKKGRNSTLAAWVRLEDTLKTKLFALPKKARSAYIREALDLMATISPPEQYQVAEPMAKERPTGGEAEEPLTPSEAQTNDGASDASMSAA